MTTAWHFEELDGPIGLLTIDLPGKPVNTLGREVMSELAEHVPVSYTHLTLPTILLV